jgi:hypothetical protein
MVFRKPLFQTEAPQLRTKLSSYAFKVNLISSSAIENDRSLFAFENGQNIYLTNQLE